VRSVWRGIQLSVSILLRWVAGCEVALFIAVELFCIHMFRVIWILRSNIVYPKLSCVFPRRPTIREDIANPLLSFFDL